MSQLESIFPSGVSDNVVLSGIPVLNTYSGNVFWVDGTAGLDGNIGTKQKPFKTLAYAIGKCTASKGDIIVLKPGHTETVSAAAGIALSKAGVTVIGLGRGASRPTFTFGTSTTTSMTIAGAGVKIQNCLFVPSVDAIVAGIQVTASDVQIVDCEWRDSSSYKTLLPIRTTSAAVVDRLGVVGCKIVQTTAGATAAMSLYGGDGHIIKGNKIVGDYATSAIVNLTTASTNVYVEGNTIENKNAVAVGITPVSTMTGSIANNFIRLTSGVTYIGSSYCSLFQNYGVNANGRSGQLIGTVST